MSAPEEQLDDLFEEVQQKLPAVSAWMYVAMWAVSEMYLRMKTHPEAPNFHEICFPHTKVPLFSKEEAKSLASIWPAEPIGGQSGGFFPPLSQVKTTALKVGNTAKGLIENADPNLLSIDHYYKSMTGFFDNIDAVITNLSHNYGLRGIESTAPDPTIPIGAFPLTIPIKIVLPLLNLIIEIFRISTTFIPSIGFLGTPTTLLLGILDLARGNLYHALYTWLGFFGKYPMYIGILLKIARDAVMLISPNLRSEMRDVTYKSAKSFFVGFGLWMFATLSPKLVKVPLDTLFGALHTQVDAINAAIESAEDAVSAPLKGRGRLVFSKIPSNAVPSMNDLYSIQQWVQNPHVYCNPEIAKALQGLRDIPPLVVLFDLMNIPAFDSDEYKQACAVLPPFASSVTAEFVPN